MASQSLSEKKKDEVIKAIKAAGFKESQYSLDMNERGGKLSFAVKITDKKVAQKSLPGVTKLHDGKNVSIVVSWPEKVPAAEPAGSAKK